MIKYSPNNVLVRDILPGVTGLKSEGLSFSPLLSIEGPVVGGMEIRSLVSTKFPIPDNR